MPETKDIAHSIRLTPKDNVKFVFLKEAYDCSGNEVFERALQREYDFAVEQTENDRERRAKKQ